MFRKNVEQRLWEPIHRGDGEIPSELHQEMVDSQLAEILSNKRTKLVDGLLKAWGFSGALVGGLAVLVAGSLMPPILPVAAISYLKAIVAVGNVTWPMGLGVMAFGKVKEWVNEFSRKKLLSQSTSAVFSAPTTQKKAGLAA